MNNNIRLEDGMGVKNVPLKYQKAIIAIAEEKRIGIAATTKENLEIGSGYYTCIYFKENEISRCTRECAVITNTVSFFDFIQAILNEPEKPKEIKVQVTSEFYVTVSKDGMRLMPAHPGLLLSPIFPLSAIDELAAAKKEIEK